MVVRIWRYLIVFEFKRKFDCKDTEYSGLEFFFMNSNGFLLIWIAINQTTLHVFSFKSKNLFQKKSKKSRAYDFDVSIKYVFSVQNSKEYVNIIILINFLVLISNSIHKSGIQLHESSGTEDSTSRKHIPEVLSYFVK